MRRRLRLSCLAVMLGAAILMSGCKHSTDNTIENKEHNSYTLSEVMLVAMTEKNRYEEVYTAQIWNVKLEEGITFEEYLQSQVSTFLDELKAMNLLALNKGVTLTSIEMEQLRKLTTAYVAELTTEDVQYMSLEEEDVLHMYQEYYTANKLVSELTKDMDLEVSDNEAKVITIAYIKQSDKDAADKSYEKVMGEGVDFESVDSVTKKQLGRGESSKSFEDAAFALEEGAISPVVQSDGAYYIIKAVSAYDKSATLERKQKLSADKKRQAFRLIYDQFLEENQVSFNHDMWNQISFTEEDETTTTNFFDLYREYFPD